MDTLSQQSWTISGKGQGPFVYRVYEECLLREVFYFDQCCAAERATLITAVSQNAFS